MVIIDVLLPVCLIFLVGYIGQKILHLHIKSVSAAALYLMLPALMFITFYQTALDETFIKIVIYGVFLSVVLIWLMKGIGLLKGYSPALTSGLILSTAFMNNGNFGAPVVLFAYGEKGFQYAVIIMTLHAIVMGTFGVYYAAKGIMALKGAFLSILKMPMIWGCVAGMLWQYLHLPLPENLYEGVSLVGDASIPAIMIVLGMQLAEIKPGNLPWGKVSLAVLVRLIISPIIAWAMAYALGVEPLLRNVMIVLAAMPSAAICTMLALQYDCEPDLVASITLLSTLLSIITLSVWLAILTPI